MATMHCAQFIAGNVLRLPHSAMMPQFIMHYLLCRDLLWLLGIVHSLQFAQFIVFIVDIVIYWDVQEIHYFTQFIARTSVGCHYIPIIPQFIVQIIVNGGLPVATINPGIINNA